MATRNGSAEWRGKLKDGEGTMTVGEGVYTGPYSFRSRFEDGEGTNPEELLAAAHAGCFTMALSGILADAGHDPESIRTTARAQLRQVDGKPTITKITLDTEARVPVITEAAFGEAAHQAKLGCIVSRALGGVDDIEVNARLVS